MKPSKIENLVYSMLTENTGTHFLDSGGAYGRSWQRNQNKSIQDFMKRPKATLELSKYGDQIEASPTIDVFHYLTNALELDKVCDKFNRMKVGNWDSEQFYGVSDKGEAYLLEHFELDGDAFNTYNWSANYSQVMQGQQLKHIDTGDTYILLQIHGGCDVRGGYTDAKLFKLYVEYFLDENCFFEDIDWMGEFITHEGRAANDDDFKALAKKHRLCKGKTVVIEGDISINGNVI
jgi:hypothetical protein